jgi:hypothetical protein
VDAQLRIVCEQSDHHCLPTSEGKPTNLMYSFRPLFEKSATLS